MGHTLRADFETLHIIHTNVVDMTLVYPNNTIYPQDGGDIPARSRCFSLKMLSATILNRIIQNDAVKGHSSAEDALACVDLLKMKMKNGIKFGTDLQVIGAVGAHGNEFMRQLLRHQVVVQYVCSDPDDACTIPYFHGAGVKRLDSIEEQVAPLDTSQNYLAFIHLQYIDEDLTAADVAVETWKRNSGRHDRPLVMVIGIGGPLAEFVYFM